MEAIAPEDFDLRSLPEFFYEDPFLTYRRLRSEAPVLPLPDGGFFLTRHRDLVEVYKNARVFSSDKRAQFAPAFGETTPLSNITRQVLFLMIPLCTLM